MNTEIRDHLLFVKGALDLMTASTVTDTGDTTFMRIFRSGVGGGAYVARVTGDTQDRWHVMADGKLEWGTGAVAPDVSLYRDATGRLRVAGNLQVDTDINVNGFGASAAVQINGGGYLRFNEIADVAAPALNAGVLYIRDNGAGKTQLVVRFTSGAIGVLYTQP